MTENMGLKLKILIVSNRKKNGSWWAVSLKKQTLNLVIESDPARSLQCFETESPDLLVLDVDLEVKAFIDLIKSLRAEMFIPIVVMTNLHSEEFLLAAYKAGADDCILKPVSPALFEAKTSVWLRRSWSSGPGIFESMKVGGLQLIPAEKTIVMDDSQPVRLTNLELRLVYNLMRRVGHAITIEELNEKIWGYSSEIDNTLIKNVVYRLRRKIELDPAKPQIIQTIPGVGYMLTAE